MTDVIQKNGFYFVFGSKFRSEKIAEMFAWLCRSYGPEIANKVLKAIDYRLSNAGVATHIIDVLDTDLKSILLNVVVKLSGYGYMKGQIAAQVSIKSKVNLYSPTSSFDEYVIFIILSLAETGEPFYVTLSKL